MMLRPPSFVPPLSWKIKSGPRESALNNWRRINLAEKEKAAVDNTKALSAVMPSVLKSIGLDRKFSELEILRVWENLMDPLIVAHAQPAGLVRGTLFINVDSNVW